MSKAKVRVGILGGGGILGSHAPGYKAAGSRCEVAVVAEVNPARHDAIRQLIGPDVEIVSDYREVLVRPDIAAVDILLPHYLHMPATIEAAEAGKHVLVEKVMARNIWECDRMIEACDAAGVSLTVSHDRRYNPAWAALKQIVDSGVLGEAFFWKLDHNQNVVMPPSSWAHWKDGIGGGAIMSCLTHQIDALRWYGGEVANVLCQTRVLPERMEGEFLGVVVATMQTGALAELSLNWWTRSHTGDNALWYEMVQVCGTHGEAYYMSNRGTFVRLHDRSNRAAIRRYGEAALDGFVSVPIAEGSGHEHCILEWVKSLRGERATILTPGHDSRKTVEVAEAAYRADKAGRRIALPIKPQRWRNSGTMPANILQGGGSIHSGGDIQWGGTVLGKARIKKAGATKAGAKSKGGGA